MRRSTNVAASVKARLLSLRSQTGRQFDHLLGAYVLERFLYRLSQSEHRDRFILKGAVLFSVWFDLPHRATRDLDLLCCGQSSLEHLSGVFREVCDTPVDPDGLEFVADSVAARSMRHEAEYVGVRVTCMALMGKARCPVQIDVGFGDAITPPPETIELTTLLGHPAPRLRAYPREAVVAEKVEAMVSLGFANSRSKDFFDVWTLAQRMPFEGARLVDALRATLGRRGTPLPEGLPLALTDEFANDAQQRARWMGFLRKTGATAEAVEFRQVIAALREFLAIPLLVASSENRW